MMFMHVDHGRNMPPTGECKCVSVTRLVLIQSLIHPDSTGMGLCLPV